MKKTIFLLITTVYICCFPTTSIFPQIQLGEGTITYTDLPVGDYFDAYSYSQVIYLASEINAAGTITGLQWYHAGTNLDGVTNWSIYISHTTESELTDWIPITSLTRVFKGSFADPGGPGWISFDITDFSYNGTDNLIIAVDENHPGTNSYDAVFNSTACSDNRSFETGNHTYDIDPTDPESGSGKQFYANIILEGITQTCPTPAYQTVDNITISSAELGWTENGSSSTWDIELGISGFTPTGTPTANDIASNPYSYGGLTSATVYDWYVRSDCGSNNTDVSIWKGPFTFSTNCDLYSASFSENFDGETVPNLPFCWNKLLISGYKAETTTADSPFSPPNHVLLYSIYPSYEAYLIAPTTNDLTSQMNQIRFYAKFNTDNSDEIIEVGTMSDPEDASTFTSFQEVNLTSGYQEHVVCFDSDYGLSDQVIAFKCSDDVWNHKKVYIDNFIYEAIPSCPPPVSQYVSNITSNSADLGWTENGSATHWDIELGLTGFTPTAIPTQNDVTSNPYTYGSLLSNTTYDWYVRADCGANNIDTSTWIGPLSFTTKCDPFSGPFTENFDGVTPPDFPDCWTAFTYPPNTSSYIQTTPYQALSPPNMVQFYCNPDDSVFLVTPEISDLTTQNYQMRFFAMVYDNGVEMEVGTMSDPMDASTFTPFQTIQLGEKYNYHEYLVMFGSTYTLTDKYIAFLFSDKPNLGLYLDDFFYELMPSCPQPSHQETANIGTTTADLSWTENGTATTWDIEYDVAGFTPTGTPTLNDLTSNPYTLSGLLEGTAYDWYLRSDCGGDDVDTSNWTGPFNFLTICSDDTAPLSENFDGITPPELPMCWTQLKTDGSSEVYTESHWSAPSSPNHICLDKNSSEAEVVLIAPPVNDLNLQSNQIRFKCSSNTSSSTDILVVGTMSDPDDISTFTPYDSIDPGYYSSDYVEYLMMFGSTYNGTDKHIAFKHHIENSNYREIYIDDFYYEAMPSCPPVSKITAGHIFNNMADLEWTENGTSTTWDIEYGLAGFTPTGTPTHNDVTANPYTLTGLSTATSYECYIRSDCGANNIDTSEWTGPYEFSTICDPFGATFSEFFDDSFDPPCWRSIQGVNNHSNADIRQDTWTYYSPPYSWLIESYETTDELYYVSPILSDLTTQLNRIRFYGYGNDPIYVGTMAYQEDISTFTPFDTVYLTLEWLEYTVDFDSDYTGSNQFICFKLEGEQFAEIRIDNFFYEPIPTCPDPSTQTTTNVSEYSVDLGWTENGSSSSWDIEWGPQGYILEVEGTLIEATSSNPYTLTGLDSATIYDWYVRANCGDGSNSEWVGPTSFFTFTTNDECATATTLAVSYDQTPTIGSTLGATDSDNPPGSIPDPGCANYQGGDVWFMATVPPNGYLKLTSGALSLYDGGMAIYTGTCGSLLLYDCDDDSGPVCMPEILIDDISLANQSIYIRFWDYGNFISGDFEIAAYTFPDSATWTGATNNNWNTATNWDVSGVPGPITNVTIPDFMSSFHYCEINVDVEMNNLTLKPLGRIEQNLGASLLCNGDLVIQSDSTGNGSLMLASSSYSPVSVLGTISVERYIPAYTHDTNGWHLISSPINQMPIAGSDFDPGPNDDLYSWNEPTNTWFNYKNGHFSEFDNGLGYLTAFEDTVTASFTGDINNSDITFTNLSIGAGNGWHLLGNPYPTALYWVFHWYSLSGISSTAQVWNDEGGNYLPLGNYGIIPSTNGFFVEVADATNSITFHLYARTYNTTPNYKKEVVDLPEETLKLTIFNDANPYYDINKVGFRADATEEWDILFDAHKLFGVSSAPQLWTVSDNEMFSVNYLPYSYEGYQLPLHFKPGVNTNYQLNAEGVNGFWPNSTIFLEDVFLGKLINLEEQQIYSFNASVGDNTDRFLLHFSKVTTIDDIYRGVNIYSYGNVIYIQSDQLPQNEMEVEVFNLMGQKVYHKKLKPSTMHAITLYQQSSIYVVRVKTEGKLFTQRVFVNSVIDTK